MGGRQLPARALEALERRTISRASVRRGKRNRGAAAVDRAGVVQAPAVYDGEKTRPGVNRARD